MEYLRDSKRLREACDVGQEERTNISLTLTPSVGRHPHSQAGDSALSRLNSAHACRRLQEPSLPFHGPPCLFSLTLDHHRPQGRSTRYPEWGP